MTLSSLYRAPLIMCCLILVSLPQAVSAAEGDASIIQGTWLLDTQATVKAMQETADPEDPMAAMMIGVIGAMKGMELAVTADTLTLTVPNPEDPAAEPQKESQTYTVKSVEGNKVEVETKDGAKTEPATFTVADGKLTMKNQHTVMIFTKKP